MPNRVKALGLRPRICDLFQDTDSAVERKKQFNTFLIKFIHSEKATKFCESFPLLLSTVHTDKSKGKISQNFVAFSEYMNFIRKCFYSLSDELLFLLQIISKKKPNLVRLRRSIFMVVLASFIQFFCLNTRNCLPGLKNLPLILKNDTVVANSRMIFVMIIYGKLDN